MSIIHKGYVDTPEGQVHYRQLKNVDGTPLVLFHQTASSGMMFEQVMTLLADDFRIIALDTPGFGASFSPPDLFTVQYLSDSLHTALTSLGVESCYTFGHHTGAAIAVQMAYDHPRFIKRAVLSGPPLLSVDQVNGLRASLQDAAQGTYQAVFDQPFGEQLAVLEIPILVMAGENDTLRASLEPAHKLLRNGEMRVIVGEGAYICDTNPQAVAEILKSFLRSETC